MAHVAERRPDPVIASAPPVVWLGVAFLGGLGLRASFGAPSPILLLPMAALPILAWRRPSAPAAALVAALAGWMAGTLADSRSARTCERSLAESITAVRGWFESGPVAGRASRRFRISRGPGGCGGTLLVVPPGDDGGPGPGVVVAVQGRWLPPQGGRGRGVLLAHRIQRPESVADSPGSARARRRVAVLGATVERRLQGLFPRRWPLVHALVLARKDGLEAELRDAFAVTGLAHLLAISGFHVGVVAALLLVLAGAAGLGRRGAAMAGAAGVWTYVLAIGAPDAAARAAVLLSLAALARLRSRPVHGLGALVTAMLLMVVVDPSAPSRVGFQLSFAGAAGLVLLGGPVGRALAASRLAPLPRAVRSALAAGVSATVATLPLVAWHFERVSLVGVPATLLVGPLVAAAIPGVFAALAGSVLSPGLGAFLAGGVEWTLDATVWLVAGMARIPYASVAVSRTTVVAVCAAVLAARLGFEVGPRLRAPTRRRVALTTGLAALIVWPVVAGMAGSGTLEAVFLDVGQGDAIALRSPRGRWVLVDTGPRSERYDAGQRVVVPYLRRRGVTRLDALVLTHPDLDHIGGAVAVLEGIGARVVFDPGVGVGKSTFLEVLEQAGRDRGVWLPLRSGRSLDFDGATLQVLHPPAGGSGRDLDANNRSVVLRVDFGEFSLLLTGDVEEDGERVLLESGALDRVHVLKVAHHGSSTSSGSDFLRLVLPEASVIQVGSRNRYGHPDAEVLRRLGAAGSEIYRTDVHGTVRILARPDGSFRVRTERP